MRVKVVVCKIISIGNNMICSDISKLLYVISRTVRQMKFETILKYHEWYLRQISLRKHAIVYTTTHKRFVILTCRYFK